MNGHIPERHANEARKESVREREAEKARCCSAQQHFHIVFTHQPLHRAHHHGRTATGGGGAASVKKGVNMGCPINGPHLTFVKSFLCLTVMLAIIAMTVIKATLCQHAEIIPSRRLDYFPDHITPVMKSAF